MSSDFQVSPKASARGGGGGPPFGVYWEVEMKRWVSDQVALPNEEVNPEVSVEMC